MNISVAIYIFFADKSKSTSLQTFLLKMAKQCLFGQGTGAVWEHSMFLDSLMNMVHRIDQESRTPRNLFNHSQLLFEVIRAMFQRLLKIHIFFYKKLGSGHSTKSFLI